MLSVTIDGYALRDGSQYRGIGTYLRHLLDGLRERSDVAVTVVDHPRLVPRRWARAEHDLRLPHLLTRAPGDVVHSPAQSPPRRCPVPWVQTLHDLTPLVFRHPLLEPERRWWQRAGQRLRQAAAVICVSRSSADQGVRLLGLDPRRVHVVPLGVDPSFTPDGPRADVAPYLLWLSSWGPHKGLDEALQVVARLRGQGRPHRLVVGGRQDAWQRAQVDATIRAHDAEAWAQVTGHVDDVAALYRGADALLATSRAEGFGLPVLEAMACGTPVVAFDNTSLPEVVGDAGLLVPDGDVDSFARALRTVLDDPTGSDLRARGPRRAKRFRWSATVDEHVRIYAACAGRG